MKHLDQIWKDWIGNAAAVVIENKILLERYVQTPQGAREVVEALAVMFAFCGVDGLWATWNLGRLLSAII